MNRNRRELPPLDRRTLDVLALRYVERFATTRARLAAYLARKISERGWIGPPATPAEIADRLAELGYIDDRLFAETRARSMARRGLGARRVALAFRVDGIAPEDAAAIADDVSERAVESALEWARRKRIGPFAGETADGSQRQRQLAQMIRGGHAFTLARRIVDMSPGDDIESLCVE